MSERPSSPLLGITRSITPVDELWISPVQTRGRGVCRQTNVRIPDGENMNGSFGDFSACTPVERTYVQVKSVIRRESPPLSTALSPGSATARGVSSTCQPRLSPAPVDNALPTRPSRHLDSPSTGPAGTGGPSAGTVRRRCRWSPLASHPSQPPGAWGSRGAAGRSRYVSITEQGSWDVPGVPEAPRDDWGDGPAAYEPGERPSRPGDRTPPQDNAAEQCGARRRCCCPRTPSPTSARCSGAPTSTGPSTSSSSTRSSTSTAGASRPTRSPSPTSCSDGASCSASAARRTCTRCRPTSRSRPTPATTPRSSARRRSCAGWSTPAPASCRWATPAQGDVDDLVDQAQAEVYQVTDRRTQRGLRAAVRHHGRRPRRDRGDRQPRRGAVRRAHRLRRPRRPHQRPARRPDDHRRGASRRWASRPSPWTCAGRRRSTTT